MLESLLCSIKGVYIVQIASTSKRDKNEFQDLGILRYLEP